MNGIYLYFVNKHRSRWPLLGLQLYLTWHQDVVRHGNVEYHPKYAIASIEDVFAFFERGYIVHYKTK